MSDGRVTNGRVTNGRLSARRVVGAGILLALLAVSATLGSAVAQSPPVAATSVDAPAGVPNPQRAWQNWTLNCQGCHRPDGTGSEGTAPSLAGTVSKFLNVPGGRDYLGRVPGVATSPLGNADLAELMNWMFWRFDKEHMPADYAPFTAEEIARLRTSPLRLEANQMRVDLLTKADESSPEVSTQVAGEPTLARSLTYWDLVLYGLAYIAPFAPLGTLGFVWSESNGLIVLAYLLGGVCMYFTAQSYATMTEALPTAGSVYGFARHSLGAFPGFLAGWMILLDYLLIPAFVYVLMAVALETLIPGVDRGVWIVLLVIITTAVNWFGITVTARANFVAVVLQVLVLLGFVALCVAALYGGKGNGGLTLKPVFEASAFDAHKIFTAASVCIMSFLGFDAVSTLAEEVQGGDRRVVGRAIIAVLILSAVFFIGITWVFGDLMPGVAIKDQSAAIYELATWATGSWTAVVLAWSYATIVGLSNALPMQVGVARVVFAMGRDKQLPSVLARIHPTYRTPYVGMLVTVAISLAVALYMKNKLDDLASIVNFGALSGFLFLHVSVLARFAVRQRSRAWAAHWLVPVCGIAVVLLVFSGMSGLAMKVGSVWLVVGIVYGSILKSKHREELRAPL